MQKIVLSTVRGKFADAERIDEGKNSSHSPFIIHATFFLFLLSAPLNLYGFCLPAFNLRFSRIFLILTVVGLILDYIVSIRPILIRLQPFDYMLGLYLLLALVSGVYVQDYGSFSTRIFGLAECILILYVVRLLTYESEMFTKSLHFYLLSSIFVILGAFYQLYSLRNNPGGLALPFPSILLTERYETLTELEHFGGSFGGFLRASSTFGEPNMMAGYCSSMIPFAMAMLLTVYERRKRIISLGYALLVIGIAIAMISAVSKSGILTAFTAIITFVFIVSKILGPRQRHKIIFLLIISLLAVGIYAYYAKDFFLTRLELLDSGHFEYRMEAIQDFIEGSLLGTGYGNYKYVSAHTLLLTALLELGILGGLVMFFLSVLPIIYLRLGDGLFSMSERDQRARMHYFFYAGGFAAYISLIIGLYLYDYWLHPFTWIGIGFFLSIISRIQDGLFHRAFRKL